MILKKDSRYGLAGGLGEEGNPDYSGYVIDANGQVIFFDEFGDIANPDDIAQQQAAAAAATQTATAGSSAPFRVTIQTASPPASQPVSTPAGSSGAAKPFDLGTWLKANQGVVFGIAAAAVGLSLLKGRR